MSLFPPSIRVSIASEPVSARPTKTPGFTNSKVNMSSIEAGGPEEVAPVSQVARKSSLAEVDRTSLDVEKDRAHHSERVDKEVAQYASDARINITSERSTELRHKIDKRVLSVMITTYFLQAVDKGTLSFASIMGLTADTGMEDAEGNVTQQVRESL